MGQLHPLPGTRATNPFLMSLREGVDLARPGDARCEHRAGGLRCVRHPHPEHPGAHVRVAGPDDRPRRATES